MTREYTEQDIFQGAHSWFWRWKRRNKKWGGIAIYRLATFANRGGVIRIAGYGRTPDQGPMLEVFVSDAGQSIRVYLDGKKMEVTP